MKAEIDTADLMQAFAKGINRVLNGDEKKNTNGFVLLVFPFDGPEGARTNYVSNADGGDMIAALKEIVGRLEGRVHDAPTAPQ